ncbi:hypothetical protein [Paludibacterium purpuratum]|uniref:Uncharacterized protein n=1 Tax=Paludibacterium purpuratum TaxID=1144873 RepID=A0A4R7B983_9NEIS|nr:hypothetical protein [Paludibacterium purpuratum]TDR81368.1 hypothetical protein DFP86_10321 [Paludibacterium purpuratum]
MASEHAHPAFTDSPSLCTLALDRLADTQLRLAEYTGALLRIEQALRRARTLPADQLHAALATPCAELQRQTRQLIALL